MFTIMELNRLFDRLTGKDSISIGATMLRFTLRFGISLLAVSWFMLSLSAQMVRVTDPQLVGTADLIVIGTVKSLTTLPNVPSWQAGQATVALDKVLRGVDSKQVVVRYSVRPSLPPGVMISDAGWMNLTVGQQQLFFLQRAQGGFSIIGGMQGMHPITDADKFAVLIANNPVTVKFNAPVGPFYFDQPVQVKMTVTNVGRNTLQMIPPMLEGFFLSERMGNLLTLSSVQDDIKPIHARGVIMDNSNQDELTPLSRNEPLVLEAGKVLELTAKFRCAAPQNWLLLSPDTYVQTAAAVQIRAYVVNKDPAGSNGLPAIPGWYIASNWQTVMVGYAPPADKE